MDVSFAVDKFFPALRVFRESAADPISRSPLV